jgi:hypothetical protein
MGNVDGIAGLSPHWNESRFAASARSYNISARSKLRRSTSNN